MVLFDYIWTEIFSQLCRNLHRPEGSLSLQAINITNGPNMEVPSCELIGTQSILNNVPSVVILITWFQ